MGKPAKVIKIGDTVKLKGRLGIMGKMGKVIGIRNKLYKIETVPEDSGCQSTFKIWVDRVKLDI